LYVIRAFIDYLKDLFERKRRAPTDDMISRLAHVEEDGEVLDEEEILATAFLMFLTGHVTTVNLIGNGVVALLIHPDQLATLASWLTGAARSFLSAYNAALSLPGRSPDHALGKAAAGAMDDALS
jgi:cytochrome P450